jgi:hypothetical protein
MSLADALAAAAKLPEAAGNTLTAGSQHAFIAGIHLAALTAAALAASAAVMVLRYLPQNPAHQTPRTEGA